MAVEKFMQNKSASLLGVGVLSGVLAVIIKILPLGLIDGWILAILWPVCFIGLILGGIGTFVKSRGKANNSQTG